MVSSVSNATVTNGRVLLADDEPALLRSYARILRGAGYEVAEAGDGHTGAELFRNGTFDVVVTDLSMPQMNGVELLQAVRERDAEAPVVLMTAGPTIDSAIRAVEFGALRYLTKPVAQDALLNVVSRAMQLRKMGELKRQASQIVLEGERAVRDRAGLEEAFDRALSTLWMAFQPIVRWSDRSVFGYEALLRSRDPALPHPGAVIGAAEKLGKLTLLGRTIRDRAAEAMTNVEKDVALFVNLHTQDLLDEHLTDLRSPLSAMARRVVLEITERASLDRIPDARSRIERLRLDGFRIAVDDLGAGYSGLSSFAMLEPEIVKLDMALIRGVDSNPTKQKVIRSITGLCRDLKIDVVAEGIETREERDTVVELGCDLLQGYLFASPGAPFPAINWEA